MLRELSTVLEELHDGFAGFALASGAGLRIATAEMTLPIDVVPILGNGGVTLLADVRRAHADNHWRADASRLHVVFALNVAPEETSR